MLWIGTRVRDRDAERQITNLNLEAASARERAGKLEERSASLEKESEQLRRETAEANGRAGQAQLQLEQLRQQVKPRWVAADFVSKMKAAANTTVEILYLRDGPDCWRFAKVLEQYLKEAGWVVKSVEPVPSIEDKKSFPQTLTAHPFGVSLVGSEVSRNVDMEAVFPPNADKPTKLPLPLLARELLKALKGYGWSDEVLEGSVLIVVAPP